MDALKTFETHLLGIPFTIITDHKALEYLVHKPLEMDRDKRWMEYMQRFEFNIEHIPGDTNTLADSLSRLYEDTTDEVTLEEYADGLQSTTEKQFSKEYLNTVSFQTDEEIQQQLNNDPPHTSYPHKPSIKREVSEIPHVMA